MPEHAMAGGRRERNGDDELRVVVEAHPIREVGPAPVEDELAFAVRLHVGGRRADQLLAVVEDERAGEPTGLLTDARRFFEACEPRVLDERRGVLAYESVPFGLRDLADAFDDAKLEAQSKSLRTRVNQNPRCFPFLYATPIDTWLESART